MFNCYGVEAAITPTVPSAPTSFFISNVAGYGIQLSWEPPIDSGGAPITGYKIYRTSAGSEAIVIEVGNVTSYLDESVAFGPTYEYKVSAVNIVGEGSASRVISDIAVPDYPDPPNMFKVTTESSKVTLTWERPNGRGSPIIHYKVYRGEGVFNGDPDSPTIMLLATLSPNVFSYTDLNATPGSTYNYCVRSTSAVGDSMATFHADVTIPQETSSLLWLIMIGIVVVIVLSAAIVVWKQRNAR